jgi:hypothetical protein
MSGQPKYTFHNKLTLTQHPTTTRCWACPCFVYAQLATNRNSLPLAIPLVSGPVIHLPGQHGKVRRDGYHKGAIIHLA